MDLLGRNSRHDIVDQIYHPFEHGSYNYLKISRQKRPSASVNLNTVTDKCEDRLGVPDAKPLFYKTDLLALTISLTCLIFAVCIITPKLPFSWRLGLELQIVVLGFLLGVMAICTQTVVPTLLLVLETKFGRSRLQNYQAILTLRFLSSHISLVWRVALFVLMVLPVGLGVAYKRFIGGSSTVPIRSIAFQNASYGLGYPPLGQYSMMNNSVYELMNCNAGLWSINYNQSLVPKSEDYPVALGYNMVLLDNGATAILDMPTQGYLNWIQGNIRTNETWEVAAVVEATVARHNQTLANRLRSDDNFFNETYYALNKYEYWNFNMFSSYDGYTNLGMFPVVVGGTADPACMLGFYNSTDVSQVLGLIIGLDSKETRVFRQAADVFSLTRERCTARWKIDKQGVALSEGSCDASSFEEVSQEVLGWAPFSLDTLPVFIHALQVVRHRDGTNSSWRLPTYASAVASSYWARAAYMSNGANTYPPREEHILSSIVTLHASWLLYLVVLVHPILTVTSIFLIASLHSTPIGRGFGLISILAGINPAGLYALRGAGFSGETVEPVTLKTEVRARNPLKAVGVDGEPTRFYMEYYVESESEDEGTPEQVHVRRKEVYE